MFVEMITLRLIFFVRLGVWIEKDLQKKEEGKVHKEDEGKAWREERRRMLRRARERRVQRRRRRGYRMCKGVYGVGQKREAGKG